MIMGDEMTEARQLEQLELIRERIARREREIAKWPGLLRPEPAKRTDFYRGSDWNR